MLKPHYAVLWLALLLALLGELWGRSQRPTPRPDKAGNPPQAQSQSGQQMPAADNRGTEQSPLIVRSIHSNEEAAQDEADRQEKASAERWNKIFSGAVAIATFLQFFALAVIIGTTRRQLRAYVFATEVRVKTLPGRKEPSIIVVFTNTGQTPAYELTISVGKKVAVYPLKIDLTTKDVPTRAGALGAGLHLHITLNEPLLTENEQQEMSDGKLAIYVFGRIEYKDAFCRRRWTTYRYYGFGGAAPLSPDREQLHVHADGNDAN